MAHGNGTLHHRLKGAAGLVMILTLPLTVILFLGSGVHGLTGMLAWIDSHIGIANTLIFFTAALWYCKLEFDEVVMDYFDGGVRSFGLTANKIIAFLAWAAAVYAIIKLVFLG